MAELRSLRLVKVPFFEALRSTASSQKWTGFIELSRVTIGAYTDASVLNSYDAGACSRGMPRPLNSGGAPLLAAWPSKRKHGREKIMRILNA